MSACQEFAAKRLKVRGDVRFGRGVIVEGDVAIEHAGPSPLVLTVRTVDQNMLASIGGRLQLGR